MKIGEIKKLYSGNIFDLLYTYLRFWEYPRLVRIEKLLPKSGLIIDLGSGYGIFSNYLASKSSRRKILAAEFDMNKTEIAKKAAEEGEIRNIVFDNKDITKLNIKNASAITIMHVLHHLKSYGEQEKVIRECVNKLEKGGVLLIDEVDKNHSWQYLLAVITDNLLYWGDRFYFRSKKDMLLMLSKFPLEIEVKNVNGALMPYPELVYVCKKK